MAHVCRSITKSTNKSGKLLLPASITFLAQTCPPPQGHQSTSCSPTRGPQEHRAHLTSTGAFSRGCAQLYLAKGEISPAGGATCTRRSCTRPRLNHRVIWRAWVPRRVNSWPRIALRALTRTPTGRVGCGEPAEPGKVKPLAPLLLKTPLGCSITTALYTP